MKGKILVGVQFGCIFALLIFTRWLSLLWWSYLLLLVSCALAMWAMMVMKLGNFNVVPTPVYQGRLVTQGPYRLIRHPMYTAVFIFAAALLAGQFDYIKLVICLLLVAGLVVKMLHEENLLCSHYPGYRAYMDRTKRVIPFVW